MAFVFGEPGGRVYGTAGSASVNLLSYWTGATNNPQNYSISAGTGRSGGSSLRIATGQTSAVLNKTLPTSRSTLGMAFALRVSSFPISGISSIAAFRDAGANQVELALRPDGTLQVTRNSSALTGGVSVVGLAPNSYAHIEWKAKIDPTVGTLEVRMNGVPIIGPLTGLNTRATANSTVNGVAIGLGINLSNSPGSIDFDDLIVWDDQLTDAAGNSDIHDFIGDCSLTWLLPTAAGTTTQFTPDTGLNFARVNEATPDGDTSYVESATVGNIDTYTMADLPAGASTIKSMAVVNYARKTDVGSRGMKHEIRTNSTNVAHAIEIPLGNSYQYYFSAWGQNPTGTPANWTVSDINALEVGRQVSS